MSDFSERCPVSRPVLRRGLYLVLTSPPQGYERLTEWAVAAEVAAVQFRPKREDAVTALRMARALRSITKGSRTLLVVNDRPDLAVLCDADGIHVGQGDLPPAEVRRLVGSGRLVGLSTHSLDQVRASREMADVDYLGFGPLFATNSKPDPDPVTGVAMLSEASRLALRPVVAIGGLTTARVHQLDRRACHAAAVIRAVADAGDPASVMRELQQLMEDRE